MIRRALGRIRSDESGLSLVELLVSGVLTIGILAMAGTMFIQTAKITTNSTQTTNSNNVASNIANEVTSVLRVAASLPVTGQTVPAPAILDGSGSEKLLIYSLSNANANNPAPVLVTFEIKVGAKPEDRTLQETRCTGTESGGFSTFGSCVTTVVRNLGGNLLTATPPVPPATVSEDQLFTYYAAGSTTPMVLTGGKLSLTQRANVAAVRVYISVKASGSTTKQVVISNKVVLGNLGLDSGS